MLQANTAGMYTYANVKIQAFSVFKKKLLHCHYLEFLEIKTNCEMYSSLILSPTPGTQKMYKKRVSTWLVVIHPLLSKGALPRK